MKKILICLLIAVLMIAPLTAQSSSINKQCWCTDHLNGTLPYTPGDTNRDGKIDSFDALQILRCCVSRLPSSDPI
ncbi:MAG: hypothetical protein IKU10_01265, partial [Clostridia bacterium]|nr:hypothetical protein [Clostridia bacterium]